MRQAGRYQPEYRAIRKNYSLLEICARPEVCAEVTRLPIEQLGVDAAILFSDITLPMGAMGMDFDIVEGRGPVFHQPIRSAEDVGRVTELNAGDSLGYVGETIGILKGTLTVPLIGFCGAPFTLASYMIEGGPSKNYYLTKAFMYNQPDAWHQLMQRLAIDMGRYLVWQAGQGADALQVFDSWIGQLGSADYARYIAPHMRTLFSEAKKGGVPLIHFGVVTSHLLPQMLEVGPDVMGIDWRIPLTEARELLGHNVPLQGNLDPALLLADWPVIEREVRRIIGEAGDGGNHIFNLGHGIMPQAEISTLRRITDLVHNLTA